MDQIRRLQPGERIPEGEPRRYADRAGYVRLRWRVAPDQLVEVLEHRVVAGVVDGRLVHHINHDASDNRPENLQVLSASEHGHVHHGEVVDWREARRLYETGMSTPQVATVLGCNPATVFRALRRHGVRIRSLKEAHRGRKDLDREVIRELSLAGMRDRAIAQRLGVSPSPVARIRKELGLPAHRQGRPTNRERGL